MNETFTKYRNKTVHATYVHVLKPIFFMRDPEAVHDRMSHFGKMLGRHYIGKKITSRLFGYENKKLELDVLGIHFKNPVGLSAGFDKNAELTDILPSVGFGFAEVGSVTGNTCAGNAKPRLWRLPKSKSLVVYYGLKNEGCETIARKLQKKKFDIPIGVSVAMTNCQENMDTENAINDFAKAFRAMEKIGSYVTVNISCPNTVGGQPFVAPDKLDALFRVLDRIPTSKPVFIKLSPDLAAAQLDAILDVAATHRIEGIITTNLTKKRDADKIQDPSGVVPGKGGLSGKPVQEASDQMLKYAYKKYGKRFVFVGNGGIFTAEDAYRKIRLGASLVQMITGMIFEGPQVISEINQGLVRLLERDGFTSIKEAVGVDNV